MAVYALGSQIPDIHPDAYLAPGCTVIGSVAIGAESTVWPGAVIRGDDGEIHIGARTSIQDGAILHTTPHLPTTVGDECVIGHLAHLEGCIVEDGALVGSGAVVLHGAVVSSGALVGAAALVPGGMVIPGAAMALGVPAKVRPDAVTPEMIALGMQSYVERGPRYRDHLRRLD